MNVPGRILHSLQSFGSFIVPTFAHFIFSPKGQRVADIIRLASVVVTAMSTVESRDAVER